MSELPPDPARLRVLLAWLEDRIADNDTVALYLQLQRAAVTRALEQAQDEREQPDTTVDTPRATGLPTFLGNGRTSGYKVVDRDGADHVSLHHADCDFDAGPARAIDANEAAAALQAGMPACAVCRPDLDLSFGD
ncbi:hypothetical protein BX257_4755 [Streptomyces sp. 3212.3]|uniref:DUF6233 domain-containing protein n=1 Tax=Streptomyces sp. 3212.3 TaxID=1938846 RepID=UPI000E36D33A|nr:DUF6233 domain-containing protein [Streptomyces sp. 3212.3]REE62142.1 hypothetical protein BX257_4755 [Streptomyces sp. 3212.3]